MKIGYGKEIGDQEETQHCETKRKQIVGKPGGKNNREAKRNKNNWGTKREQIIGRQCGEQKGTQRRRKRGAKRKKKGRRERKEAKESKERVEEKQSSSFQASWKCMLRRPFHVLLTLAQPYVCDI